MNQSDWIFKIVDAFYDKAKTDVLIGYHFRNIQDFDSHIPRIAGFWELQLLGSTERKLETPFDMMNVHLPLKIKPGELGRWLVLFRKTLDEHQQADFLELQERWLDRLKFFEGVFSRFLTIQNS